MQISDNEVKKILELGSIESQINQTILKRQRAEDEALVADVVARVNDMDDREDRIMDLKARIEAGTYNPTGAEIADAMIRRSIADRLVG